MHPQTAPIKKIYYKLIPKTSYKTFIKNVSKIFENELASKTVE